MVLVGVNHFYDAYSALREDASSKHAGGVMIFASDGDCDSLCALRILERLFELDSVRHSRFAVSGYEELQKYSEKWHVEGDEPRAVVLVNCGGGEDVRGLFGLDELPSTRIFIVDAHRPLHHRNLDEQEAQVLVFQDKDEDGGNDEVPGLSDDERSTDGDADDDDTDEDDENDEDDDNDDEDDGEEDEDEDRNRVGRNRDGERSDEDGRATVRRRISERDELRVRRRDRRKSKTELRRRRAEYYSRGSFFGMAAGCLIYELASLRLHKDVSELLW